MAKIKMSGPALFMNSVIVATALLAIVCFVLYYAGFIKSGAVLWTGITAFTILYHFWLRIIMGNVTRAWRIDYRHPWFREKPSEKKLYKWLRVKSWKNKAFTYDPKSFSLKDRTLEGIATTMAKSETDHWINEVISITTMFFGLFWGMGWLFAATAVAAMIFDAQFIVMQRFNRPRILRLLEKMNRKG